jgi:hypothetical protein
LHYFRNKAQTYSILSAFEKINQVKNMIIVKNHNLRGLSRLKPLYLLLFFENGHKTKAFYERLKTELDNANRGLQNTCLNSSFSVITKRLQW